MAFSLNFLAVHATPFRHLSILKAGPAREINCPRNLLGGHFKIQVSACLDAARTGPRKMRDQGDQKHDQKNKE